MKNNLFMRSVSVLLCVASVASLCGCGAKDKETTTSNGEVAAMELMEEETVYAHSFDFIGGEDVMPIGGFYGPTASENSVNGIAMPDYVNDEVFEMIADSGINLITYSFLDYKLNPKQVLQTLELGEKYGVGITVFDRGMKSGDEYTVEDVDARLNEYANYPAFCGSHVVDEPISTHYAMGPSNYISSYAPKMNALAALDVWGYGNLLPNGNASTREKYKKYVDEWLTTTDVKMLMWDHYVHDEGVEYIDYFWSLSFGRETAAKYERPFWVFIQAGSQWGEEPKDTPEHYPNEGQFLWNVNTSLAYGAKGIAYFPLIQPYFYANAISQAYDFERMGIIGASFNKNRWWYYAQIANKQIRAIDEVLMHSVNKGVIVTSNQAKKDNADSSCIIKGTSWRELKDITGDVMVGCFNYRGKSAFYVVNYDMEYAQDITMSLDNTYNFSVIQKGEKVQYQGNNMELTMKPGEGVLVVME